MVDNKEDDSLPHGGVKGIKVPKDKISNVIGIWEKHFNAKPDAKGKGGALQFKGMTVEVLDAVQLSMKPPVCVPVRRANGEEDFFVIEFDVNPVSSLCGDTVFSIRTNEPGGKLNIKYFYRSGASSVQYEERYYNHLQTMVKDAQKCRQVISLLKY